MSELLKKWYADAILIPTNAISAWPSTLVPSIHRAGPRAAESGPKDTLKLGRSGDYATGTFGGIFGAASAAPGPTLWFSVHWFIRLRGKPVYLLLRPCT